MKVKREYVILAVVIVVLCLILVLRKGDRTHYRLPEIKTAAVEEITRLVISRADTALTLERSGSLWKIAPYGYPADTSQVNRMLKAVAGFALTALASEAGNYAPYELDAAKRIGVEAFAGDRSVLKVSLGKPAPTYSHTFVLLESDPRIYQARENLRADFDKDIGRLRDKVVLSVDKAAVTSIAFVSGRDSLALRRGSGASGAVPPAPGDTAAPAPPPAWQAADGAAADEQTVDRVIDQLASLRCESFIEGKAKSDFANPIFTLRAEGGESVALSIFDKREGASYPAISSESDYPFYLAEWAAKQLMKKREEIVKEAPAVKR